MKLSNLEYAAQIYWSTDIDIADCQLTSAGNPESQFMMKELVEKLSDEAKLMFSTIANLPDEMFYASGKIILRELKSWMKRRYGWSPTQIERCRKEISKAFGEVI